MALQRSLFMNASVFSMNLLMYSLSAGTGMFFILYANSTLSMFRLQIECSTRGAMYIQVFNCRG